MKPAFTEKRSNDFTPEIYRNKISKNLSRPVMTIILSAALLFMIAFNVNAAGRSSARGVAMGQAFIGLAAGVDAARYNPANLGFSGYRESGFELVGIGADISNNSFTLDDYNRYTGALLSDRDKEIILDDIPAEGLNLVADIEASALSLSNGSFVFSVSGIGLADVILNKDIIDLILNGNSLADTIDLNGSHLDAVGFVSAGFSYGRTIYNTEHRQIAVGGTFKYLRGLAVEQIVALEGKLATNETGFGGKGRLIARTAEGGSGYAFDIGAAVRINNKYTVGVRFENLLSSLRWNRNPEEHGYIFSFDTMTVDNMSDDYVVSDDYRRGIPAFSTNLPSTINLGIARTTGSLLWAVDWHQGFRRAAGSSSKPRLSFGIEWWPLTSFPLRCGFSTGGHKNTSFSFGSGINTSFFYTDLAIVTGTAITPYSAKELNFAVTTGIRF